MGLAPKKESVGTLIPIFSKILEVFTGGFSLVTSGFNTGVTLPAGSLLTVDENARTATPVKTAIIVTSHVEGTGHKVAKGHHFVVGDKVARIVGRGGHAIESIVSSGANDMIILGTSIGKSTATGGVLWITSAQGTDQAALGSTPNSLSLFPVILESGGSISAVRRATAYKNRIQAHVDGHLTSLASTIQISKSK